MSWDALAVILGPGGAVVVLIEMIRRDRATRRRDEAAKVVQVATAVEAKAAAVEAKEKAAEAADLARPTGNGFAGSTTSDLKAILAGQARSEAAQARMEEAQRQQIDSAGRTVERLNHVAERLDQHIDDHMRGLLKAKEDA